MHTKMKQIHALLLAALLTFATAPNVNVYAENADYTCSDDDYLNPSLSFAQRATDLLRRLTIDDKIALMVNDAPAIEHVNLRPYEWWSEALHGVGRAGIATVFPQAIAMAASFDDKLLYDVFCAVSDEARAKNALFIAEGSYRRYQGLTFWTPNVNIFRDPRWGRGQETYGEDPYLAAVMGVAAVKGLQTSPNKFFKLHACAKHFAVHSGPEWNRHSFDAKNISQRDLHETYLYAFERLVKQGGVREVMCAYNRYEGEPCCGSRTLLIDILRNKWNFDGVVVSDCGAINDFYMQRAHHTHLDAKSASASAVRSGCDLECGSSYKQLKAALSEGLITEAEIDTSVWRLLRSRFELGMMEPENPFSYIAADVVASAKHDSLALRMAEESVVLLQNKNGLLPLTQQMTIALVGPNANDSVMQWGNYAGTPPYTATLLGALTKMLPDEKLIYEPLCSHTDGTVEHSMWNLCSHQGRNGFGAKYWNEPGGPLAAEDHLPTPPRFNTLGETAFAAGVSTRSFTAHYTSTFAPDHDGEAVLRMCQNGQVKVVVNADTIAQHGRLKYPTDAAKFRFVGGEKYTIDIFFRTEKTNSDLYFDLVENLNDDPAEALERIAKADVIIFAGGISPRLEGEEMSVNAEGFRGGDRTDIELPAIQRQMIRRLGALGKPIIMVNYSGSAVALLPESETCDALLQAWYPGQAGGTALANIIFGITSPSGKLPITFYESQVDLPDFEDYNMRGRTYRYYTGVPLYPFGHGLTYGNVKIEDATIDNQRPKVDRQTGEVEQTEIAVTLHNAGSREATEVLQIYIARPDEAEEQAQAQGPNQTLRAFQRVTLAAGERKTIVVPVDSNTLQWYNPNTQKMEVLRGAYNINIGLSSATQTTLNIICK